MPSLDFLQLAMVSHGFLFFCSYWYCFRWLPISNGLPTASYGSPYLAMASYGLPLACLRPHHSVLSLLVLVLTGWIATDPTNDASLFMRVVMGAAGV